MVARFLPWLFSCVILPSSRSFLQGRLPRRSWRLSKSASNGAYHQYLQNKRETERRLEEERVQREYHDHLNRIAAGDEHAIQALGNIEDWMKYAAEGISLSPNGYGSQQVLYERHHRVLHEEQLTSIAEMLDHRGFTMLSPESFHWEDYGISFTALAETMANLVSAGWPPVFIFLFDQPWLLCLRLFDIMSPLLKDEKATLEASMHAWSLQRQPKDSSIREKVGGNFGVPHRDITYKNCHNIKDGSPDILSLWIPLVDVNSDNGCMYVVPRESDPQFDKDDYPKDQDPFSHRFQYAAVKPLSPISAGTTLIWHPNLIHWGGSCSYYSELPPRKSIAVAFRVRESTRPSTDREIERYGRVPYSREELLHGGPDYKARLRMIVKSLILYNVWYPTYDGLALEKIDAN